ncbi:hypothetical protein EJI00_02080 [Variovorax sp. DXTD-1]|nr:hypothetical protein EJI00_02080 [Variovorax sp. DXTD-1]
MKKPDIKLNPHPKMRYEITLTIEDAPGPFDAVEGFSSYQVSNNRCVPLQPISGAQHTPRKSVPLSLTRVSDKLYKGTFYVDYLQDENYFGLGVCQWSMTFVGFSLQIGNLVFSHSLDLNEALAGKPVPRFFNNGSYFSEYAKSKKDDHPLISSGRENRSDFGQDSKNTFSMTLTAKEKFQ